MGTKFFLYLLPIHAVALVLAFFVFEDNKLLFFAAELLVIGSLLLGYQIYRQFSQPIDLLLTGLDAIKDQDFNVKLLPTGKYEIDKLIGVYNNMIDHLRQERTKQEQQHFFLDKLIQTSPTGIIILDYDDRIAELNPQAAQLLAISPDRLPLGRSLADIDHPLARAAASLATGQTRTVTIQGVETYKCQKAHFIDRGFSRRFVMIEELTSEILRAEKNAYGKVIRLMAHEVNNTIGAINAILHTTLGYADQLPEPDRQEMREAQTVCIERNDRLNRFMRNFADIVRLPAPSRESYDLRRLLQNIARLMEIQAADRRISLQLDLPAQPVYAAIDVQQMELVLVNAVKNALESIGQEGVVQLILQSRPTAILIRDNGPGIAPEMEEKLFSPFFTTKRDGQGIGLTLSREILLNHGFGFHLKTREDGWTEFAISLK